MAIKSESYKKACEFRKKYPLTIGWRIKQHCKIIDRYVDGDEKVEYVFYGQKNEGSFDFANTYVIALTNKRIVLGTKRVLFYLLYPSLQGFIVQNACQSSLRTARNAFCGTSTLPICFIRFLPRFCFSRSLRLRLTSPP